MRKTGMALAAGFASVMLISGAGVANAAGAAWSGTVDSGGKVKIFNTQRTATQTVRNGNESSTALGLGLVACTSLSVVSADRRVGAGNFDYFNGSANRCFRQAIHRWTAADTNGWLPGNGTTSVKGYITW